MTTLGIGVRVYVGFIFEPENFQPNPKFQTGTIIDGPVPPNTEWKNFRTTLKFRGWEVALDKMRPSIICESYLFPIDDWDEGITNEKEKESPKQLEIVR